MPEPIQPEAAYRLPVQQDGGACDLYFFRAWTGYAHPVRPRDPLTWREALAGAGHCQVTFCDPGDGPRIVVVRSVGYQRVPWRGPTPPQAEGGADRYLEAVREGELVRAGKALGAAAAAETAEFLFFRWGEDGRLDRSELVSTPTWIRYGYTYGDGGKLRRVLIANPERTSTLDY